MPISRIMLSLILLRAKPQDIPYSNTLLYKLLLVNFSSGVFVVSSYESLAIATGVVLSSLLILLVFTWYLLEYTEKRARFNQTASALAGTGALFNLLVWPLYVQLAKDELPATTEQMLVMAVYLLLSWNVLVMGYIFKHALETSMLNALIISFMLLLISLILTQSLFAGA